MTHNTNHAPAALIYWPSARTAARNGQTLAKCHVHLQHARVHDVPCCRADHIALRDALHHSPEWTKWPSADTQYTRMNERLIRMDAAQPRPRPRRVCVSQRIEYSTTVGRLGLVRVTATAQKAIPTLLSPAPSLPTWTRPNSNSTAPAQQTDRSTRSAYTDASKPPDAAEPQRR